MAKRLIDISTLPKAWRKLDCNLKLAWFYLWNNCDPAGVWEIDEDLFEFQNNFSLDIKALSDALGDLIEYDSNKVLLTNFIAINQCDLKKLNPNYNPHKPVFRSINKYQLKLDLSLNQASMKLVVGVEVEAVDGVEDFGKSENLLEDEREFIDSTASYFSQTTIHLKEKFEMFIFSLMNRDMFEEFKRQTKAYIDFKKLSGQQVHRWLGYQADWQTDDWVHKLESLQETEVKSKEVSVKKDAAQILKTKYNLK